MTAPRRAATLNRPNMVSVGTIVFLSQELMFFAGLFAMYFVSRANGQGDSWDWGTGHLNVPYALLITVILVSSSFTAQWGVFTAERGDVFALRKWYALSTALGAIFLVGQAYEYFTLVSHGLTIQNSIYGSVFWLSLWCLSVPPRRSSPRHRPLLPLWSRTTGTSSTSCGLACSSPSTSSSRPYWPSFV